jgi:hypothetical protein
MSVCTAIVVINNLLHVHRFSFKYKYKLTPLRQAVTFVRTSLRRRRLTLVCVDSRVTAVKKMSELRMVKIFYVHYSFEAK